MTEQALLDLHADVFRCTLPELAIVDGHALLELDSSKLTHSLVRAAGRDFKQCGNAFRLLVVLSVQLGSRSLDQTRVRVDRVLEQGVDVLYIGGLGAVVSGRPEGGNREDSRPWWRLANGVGCQCQDGSVPAFVFASSLAVSRQVLSHDEMSNFLLSREKVRQPGGQLKYLDAQDFGLIPPKHVGDESLTRRWMPAQSTPANPNSANPANPESSRPVLYPLVNWTAPGELDPDNVWSS